MINEKMFTCVPLNPQDADKAKFIEYLANSPNFIQKTKRATEMFIQRFTMQEILYGKQFTAEELEDGYKTIVEEVNRLAEDKKYGE